MAAILAKISQNNKISQNGHIIYMATLFNNYPHISSSANWRATASYVGMVVE